MSKVHAQPFAQIPEWVLDADISDRATRLFSVLHRYANSDGRAFPGRKAIAERMRCSVDSVDRAMNELVAIEAVHVKAEWRNDGSQTSNSYWLWPLLPDTVSAPPTQPSGPGAADLRSPLGEDAAPYRKESQRNERQRNENTSASDDDGTVPPLFELKPSMGVTAAAEQAINAAFDEFWNEYPRKRDRTPAYKAFRRALARGVDSRCMIEGARRYAAEIKAAGTKKDHVKYGERWINAEAWQNVAEETQAERLIRLAKQRGEQARANGAAR